MPEGVGVEQAAQTLQHLVRTEPLRPVPQVEFVVETGRVLPLIVLQNFVNSYQIYKKDREAVKNQI